MIKANEVANLMGMDTVSLGGVIQWAMESYEKGLISSADLDGIDLRWGNGAAVVEMAGRIGRRQGFGDVLARGVKQAAAHVGGDSYKWAVQAKGLEMSRVDSRSSKAYALAFAVNPRGPDHLFTETFAEFGMGPEARALVARLTGSERYTEPYCSEKRAEIVRWHEDCYAVTDALGVCAFTTTALYGINPALMAELYSAATGIETSEEELMAMGRRILTLEKCLNVRNGATRADDTLPWRIMHEATPDHPGPDGVNSPVELARMLDEYYDLHGWDRETSWPTRETLDGLGLADVAGDFAGYGKTGKRQGAEHMKIALRLLGLGKGGGLVNSVVEAVEGCTVNDLIRTLPEEVRAQMQQVLIIVIVNGRQVGRDLWGTWRLQEGDTVSALQGLAGG